ncbi:tyrosine-protein phosphatase [Collimonas fungivorans]|uniref:tyrosine-protein phosphatase n=1 Tax=Collimonas fungivorans TaxID=158899 RepID=UPI003FA399BE
MIAFMHCQMIRSKDAFKICRRAVGRMLNPGPGHGELGFEAIRNVRDLGGYLAADGRRIAAGRLLRSANPGMASAAEPPQRHGRSAGAGAGVQG